MDSYREKNGYMPPTYRLQNQTAWFTLSSWWPTPLACPCTTSNACTQTLANPVIAWKTLGRPVWRLFSFIAWLIQTEFRYLPFSSSAFFFNASIFSRSTKNESLGLGPEAFKVSWDFFSILLSWLTCFSSLFSSREHFFCSLHSSSCCNTIEWMTDMKLLMASEVPCYNSKK